MPRRLLRVARVALRTCVVDVTESHATRLYRPVVLKRKQVNPRWNCPRYYRIQSIAPLLQQVAALCVRRFDSKVLYLRERSSVRMCCTRPFLYELWSILVPRCRELRSMKLMEFTEVRDAYSIKFIQQFSALIRYDLCRSLKTCNIATEYENQPFIAMSNKGRNT